MKKAMVVLVVLCCALALSSVAGLALGIWSPEGLSSLLAPAPEDGWAIIDSEGSVISRIRFSDADDYGFASNGLAAVKDTESGLWGYVREDGSWAIEPRFESVGPFRESGVAAVRAEGVSYWIDESGEAVGGPSGTGTWVAGDESTGLVGIMGDDGSWALDPIWEGLIPDLRSDLILARPQGSKLWGIIDASGQWVLQPDYPTLVQSLGPDMFAAQDAGTRLWGYVRPDGTWLIEPSFAGVTRMSADGHALAKPPEGE
ncbi:MAG: WG repeat-containing protein [Olsenella sp.]|jgi:hypothetical protein|nr:WG repeat-containing protein [Olsenella sp.]